MKNSEQTINQVNELIRQATSWKERYDQVSRDASDYRNTYGNGNTADWPPNFRQTCDRFSAEENEASDKWHKAEEAMECRLHEIKESVLADGDLQETLDVVTYLRSMSESHKWYSYEIGRCAIEVARQGLRQFQDSLELKEQLFDLLEKGGYTDELITLLRESLQKSPQDTHLRQRLAEVLEKAGRPIGLKTTVSSNYSSDLLWPRLNIGSATVRSYVAQALKERDESHMRERLINLLWHGLNDSSSTVRAAAAQALKETEDDHTLERLADLLWHGLTNSFNTASLAAAQALREVGEGRIRESLINLLWQRLNDRYSSSTVRVAAARTLGQIGDAGFVEQLKQALLAEKDSKVRSALAESLSQQGAAISVEELKQALWAEKDGKVRLALAEALSQIGDASSLEGLKQAFRAEQDNSIRQAMMDLLGKLDHAPRKSWEKWLGLRPWAR